MDLRSVIGLEGEKKRCEAGSCRRKFIPMYCSVKREEGIWVKDIQMKTPSSPDRRSGFFELHVVLGDRVSIRSIDRDQFGPKGFHLLR